ncbi:hypothetical protein M8J77_021201 [Diaphorina citri]|nr:hypothetical protein M8J77_021201 [Diaphorina citri]
MFRWISEFISQRYCATRYSDSLSSYKQTHAGLPQGAVTSTTLFNVFVNDLLQTLEKTGDNTHNKKDHVSAPEAKAIALSTIHTRYPAEEWLHIYTDGSLRNPEEGAGAGITCDLFSFYKSLGKYSTNYDGEISAIKIALEHLMNRLSQFQNVVILSDSKAAIQAIVNLSDTPSTLI